MNYGLPETLKVGEEEYEIRTDYRCILDLPVGSKVKCYGYYTGKWLLVQSDAGYTGFCHTVNLKKD